MFRSTVLLCAGATALSACAPDPIHLDHRSTLMNATRGVVLLGDGVGHGAMLDTTCAFNGNRGSILADVNLPTSTERIGGGRGDQVVGFSSQGVHMIARHAERSWSRQWDRDLAVSGVIDAELTRRGPVYLRRTGVECFVGGAALDPELAVGPCSPQARLLADWRGDRQWIHDQDTLLELTPTGPAFVAEADVAVYDRRRDAPLLAQGSLVIRLDDDGRETLRVDVGDRVTSLADLGARGSFAAVTDDDTLVLHDSAGDALTVVRLPSHEGVQVVTSLDGEDLSLVTERETHNYQILDGPPRSTVQVSRPPAVFTD
jgi:hypothetical protein